MHSVAAGLTFAQDGEDEDDEDTDEDGEEEEGDEEGVEDDEELEGEELSEQLGSEEEDTADEEEDEEEWHGFGTEAENEEVPSLIQVDRTEATNEPVAAPQASTSGM